MQDLTVEQQVILPNLNQTNGLENKEIILIDENGNITRGDQLSFIEAIGKELYLEKMCSSDGIVNDAHWMNGTNKIFL